MNLIKLLIFSGLSLFSNAQLMGAQKDPSGNGCSLDGGYSWCKYLNECIRPWEKDCIATVPADPLNIGDICYRFCEDNSQEHIDRKKECPLYTQCISNFNKNSVSMIAYDSCDDRAWTCSLPIH